MSVILTLKKVTKYYGNGGSVVKALNEVDLEMEKGEFVAIMGPSGSGKSTLLSVIATIEPPSGGDIIIDNKSLRGMKEKEMAAFRRDKLGFVFQDFLLLDGLTVRQNILLPAIIGGSVSSAEENRADRLCEVFGICAIRDKYPAEISGGEKQRTAVARALINQPLLILADEPTGNLDSKSSRAVIHSFEQAKTALGATIFMVTHDSFAASFCDRVIILRDGLVWRTLTRGETQRAAFQDRLLDAVREMGKE